LLYKYASFTNEKYLREIIVENKIYFTSPFDFNDPFDCRPRFMVGVTRKEIQKTKAIAVEILGEYTALNRKSRKAVAEFVLNGFGPNQIEKEFQRALGNRGVYCLTSKQDNLLMWSHYGDKHRGVCIEFSTEPLGSFFSHAKPIRYTNDYPIIRGYAGEEDWGSSGVLTKSLDWEYEQEWRLLANLTGHLVFPSELLIGIIFGCRTIDKNIGLVKDWIAERGKPVKLKKANMNNKQFKVDIADF